MVFPLPLRLAPMSDPVENSARIAAGSVICNLTMERGDEALVGEVREFGLGKFGEGAREGGFVGALLRLLPAAERAQGGVATKRMREWAGRSVAEDTLGNESVGDGAAICAGPAIPSFAGKIAVERNHGAGCDEECVAVADLTAHRFQAREEFGLQDAGEVRKGIGKVRLPLFNA